MLVCCHTYLVIYRVPVKPYGVQEIMTFSTKTLRFQTFG